MQIVQVDQKFVFHRPIRSVTSCTPWMESIPSSSASVPTSWSPEVSDQRRRRTRDGGLHHADGSRRRQLDPAQVGPESGRSSGPQVSQRRRGLVTRNLGRCTLGPRGFPNYSALSSVSDRPIGERVSYVSPEAQVGLPTSKGRSSTGRAAVSKTAGCRFKSCRPCQVNAGLARGGIGPGWWTCGEQRTRLRRACGERRGRCQPRSSDAMTQQRLLVSGRQRRVMSTDDA